MIILVADNSILAGDIVYAVHDVDISDEIGSRRHSIEWRVLTQGVLDRRIETQFGACPLRVFCELKELLESHIISSVVSATYKPL